MYPLIPTLRHVRNAGPLTKWVASCALVALLAACGGQSDESAADSFPSMVSSPAFALGEAPRVPPDASPQTSLANGPTKAQLQKVLFAQALVQASDDPDLALSSRRDLLVLVQLTNSDLSEGKPIGNVKVLASNGALLDELPLRLPDGEIPATLPDAPSFASAHSVTVPGKHVLPGMRLELSLAGGQLTRSLLPKIGPEQAVTLVAVPIRIANATGEVPADLGAFVAARLPFSSVRVILRPAYTMTSASTLPTTPADWDALFRKASVELMQLQIDEGGVSDLRNFYVGFVPNNVGTHSFSNYATRVSAVADEPGSPSAALKSVVHELGHQLFLQDAPCGPVQGADKAFPYANATLGAGRHHTWGFLADSQSFVDPRDPERHDAMSRCAGDTFSDYNYLKMMAALLPGGPLAPR